MKDDTRDDRPPGIPERRALHKEPQIMSSYGKMMLARVNNLTKLADLKKQQLEQMGTRVRSTDPIPYRLGRPAARLTKIISGGQTGVDRAALDAGMKHGFLIGGWCPEGRLAEDGQIPDHYPLDELPGGGYSQRTRQNVRDSDATLIIYYDQIHGGTKLTLSCCLKEKKPFLLIDAQNVPVPDAADKVLRFVGNDFDKVLNVAGPRGSSGNWAYSYAYELVDRVLDRVIYG